MSTSPRRNSSRGGGKTHQQDDEDPTTRGMDSMGTGNGLKDLVFRVVESGATSDPVPYPTSL